MSNVAAGATGLDRIRVAFADSGKRAALMPYLMGGYPSLAQSREIAQAYIDSGADLIELGVPFSDPLADGPVLHQAATTALRAGATIDGVIELVEQVAGQVPVLVMTYVNPVAAHGGEQFIARVAKAGAAGMIIPDLPLEEAAEIGSICRRHGLALVPLVAPTTDDERMAKICANADGFIYTVSVTGTTGERNATSVGLGALVERVRAVTDLPVAVGFGISEPDQASAVADVADGVIVGTRLVREVADGLADKADFKARVGDLVSSFAAAIR